jgi:hypothetical protein
MSALEDAVLILGEERVAEIRANVDDLLKQVLANRARYARKRPLVEQESCLNAA